MVRFFLACVMSLATGATAMAAGDLASDLKSKAQSILDKSPELSAVWPGYWPESQGFVLYHEGQGAILVGADGQSRTMTYRTGELPDAHDRYVLDYPGGAPNMILVKIDDDWTESLTILFHEQFHDFQRDRFERSDRRSASDYVDLSSIRDRAAFAAAVEIERRVLIDALVALNDTDRNNHVRQYIALRQARSATVDGSILSRERYLERYEGTARYAGYRAAGLVLNFKPEIKLVEGLQIDLIARDGNYTAAMFPGRAYDVGGALAWLLDRSSVEDWESQVQAGEPLDEILARSLGDFDSAEQDRLVASAAGTHGSDRILADVSKALAAAPKMIETSAEFLSQGARRLVIDVAVPRSRLVEGRQFSETKNMIAVGPRSTAYLDVRSFRVEWPGISLRLEGHSIMTDSLPTQNGVASRLVYVITIPEGVVLAGLDQLETGSHSLDELHLVLDGLTINIDEAVTVGVTEDQITLTTAIPSR